jgi:hypothetical protein
MSMGAVEVCVWLIKDGHIWSVCIKEDGKGSKIVLS